MFWVGAEPGSGGRAPSPPERAGGEGSVEFWSLQGRKEKCALGIQEAEMYLEHRNTRSGVSERP